MVVRKNFVHQSHRRHRRRRVSRATMELNRFTTVATRARVVKTDRRCARCVLVHQMMCRQLIIRVLTKYLLCCIFFTKIFKKIFFLKKCDGASVKSPDGW